jgi:hypothetical protein
MKNIVKNLFWTVVNIGISVPFLVNAAGEGETPPAGSGADLTNPLNSDSFSELVTTIAKLAFKIGIPIAAVFIIYSGLLFVTARGNEQQLEKAKKNFYWAIAGTAILLGATVIAETIKDTIESF